MSTIMTYYVDALGGIIMMHIQRIELVQDYPYGMPYPDDHTDEPENERAEQSKAG